LPPKDAAACPALLLSRVVPACVLADGIPVCGMAAWMLAGDTPVWALDGENPACDMLACDTLILMFVDHTPACDTTAWFLAGDIKVGILAREKPACDIPVLGYSADLVLACWMTCIAAPIFLFIADGVIKKPPWFGKTAKQNFPEMYKKQDGNYVNTGM